MTFDELKKDLKHYGMDDSTELFRRTMLKAHLCFDDSIERYAEEPTNLYEQSFVFVNETLRDVLYDFYKMWRELNGVRGTSSENFNFVKGRILEHVAVLEEKNELLRE